MSWVFYLAAALIAAWTVFFIVRYVRRAAKGKCSCGCTNCPNSSKCSGRK